MSRRIYEQRGIRAFCWFTRFARDSIRCMVDLRRKCDLFIGHRLLPWGMRGQKSLLAFGPEYNRQILGDIMTYRVTPLTAGGPPDSSLRRIRHGVIGMNGEEHRDQRQLVAPWFVKKTVDGYHDTAVRLIERQVAGWRTGSILDISREMQLLSLRISTNLLFGRESTERAEALGTMIQELFERNFSPWALLFPLNLPGAPFRGLLRHAELIERTLLEAIARRRQTPTGEPDILDRLIAAHAQGQMSDAALLGQATILFFASYETQASSLTWALFLLAQHPAIMADLVDELAGALHGEPPTIEQVEQLPLLDAVLKESMRVLTTVPYTIRAVTQPAELDGVPLQFEDRVVCSYYVTHHLPEIYANPERFDPQRWFTIRPTPYEYLPFGGGPRICIGRTMSLQIMKAALAMILQRCKLEMAPRARIDRVVKVTLSPKYGMPMIVKPHDGQFEAIPVSGNIHEMVDLTRANLRVVRLPASFANAGSRIGIGR